MVINFEGHLPVVVPVEDIEESILGWLREGDDSAPDIVDLPWVVNPVRDNVYLAEHPRLPFTLLLVFSDEFVQLVVPLGLETLSMSTGDRLRVYHTLLKLNDDINLLKYTLSGMNDEVTLRVDLDKKTLGKDEFNDALTVLLIGLQAAVTNLGLEEEFANEVFERLVGMVVSRLEKGATEEELMRFLTQKVGMPEKDAKELLNTILQAQKETLSSSQDVGYF